MRRNDGAPAEAVLLDKLIDVVQRVLPALASQIGTLPAHAVCLVETGYRGSSLCVLDDGRLAEVQRDGTWLIVTPAEALERFSLPAIISELHMKVGEQVTKSLEVIADAAITEAECTVMLPMLETLRGFRAEDLAAVAPLFENYGKAGPRAS